MADDDSISVKFSAEVENAISGIGNLADSVNGIVGQITGLSIAFNQVTEAFNKIAGPIEDAMAKFEEMGSELLHVSEELGVTTETAAEFSFVAGAMGIDAGQAGFALTRLERNMSLAATGIGIAANAFIALGISVTDGSGHLKNLNDILPEIAARFAATADGPEKTAIAIDLLGRTGARLIPFLNQGAAGMEKLKEISEETSTVLSHSMAAAAEESSIKAYTLKEAMEGVAVSIGSLLQPVIDKLVYGLTRVAEGFSVVLNQSDYAKIKNLSDGIRELQGDIAELEKEMTLTPSGDYIGSEEQTRRLADYNRRLKESQDAIAAVKAEEAQKDTRPGLVSPEELARAATNYQSALQAQLAMFRGTKEQEAALEVKYWQNVVELAEGAQDKLSTGNANLTIEEQKALASRQEAVLKFLEATKSAYQLSISDNRAMTLDAVQTAIKAAQDQYQIKKDEFDKEVSLGTMKRSAALAEETKLQTALEALQEKELRTEIAASDTRVTTEAAVDAKIADLRANLQATLSKLADDAAKDDKADMDKYYEAYKTGISQQLSALKDSLSEKTINEEEWYGQSAARLQAELAMAKSVYGEMSTQYGAVIQQMNALDKQHAEDQAKTWKSAEDTIDRSFDTMLSGVLQGTQTWQQAFERMCGNLVLAFIESQAKILLNDALTAARDLAIHLATEAGIVQAHTTATVAQVTMTNAGQVQQTTATTTGVAARTAIDNSGQVSFLGSIVKMIAGWLGFETQKTAATVAGATASNAAMIAGGMAQISIDAAVAAAGTEAFFAWEGPEVSIPAAAAAYAYTMGWAAGMGGGAFADGAWSLPNDMIAQVHAGEMIIPASVASQIRSGSSSGVPSFASSAPSTSDSGDNSPGGVQTLQVNFNVQAIDAQGVANFFKGNGPALSQTIATMVRNSNANLVGAIRAANSPLMAP